MAAEVTSLDLLTLTVAIVGAVTGIVALVVQAIQFRASGPRITVELLWAWLASDGSGAITAPMDGRIPDRSPAVGMEKFNHLAMAVKVRNSGRLRPQSIRQALP